VDHEIFQSPFYPGTLGIWPDHPRPDIREAGDLDLELDYSLCHAAGLLPGKGTPLCLWRDVNIYRNVWPSSLFKVATVGINISIETQSKGDAAHTEEQHRGQLNPYHAM
jgi:hypothetical protein